MKPGLRVVTHLHRLAELSKAQRKNSPQALLYAFGQDNLQKASSSLVGDVVDLDPRGGVCGIRGVSVLRFPTNPCVATQLPTRRADAASPVPPYPSTRAVV